MRTSESIKNIAAALSKAQATTMSAIRKKENEAFKRGGKVSKYADLEAVWDACRKPMTDNGLSVVQGDEGDDGVLVRFTTRLMHESGEWIETTATYKPSQTTPQGIGSAHTYARRYGVCDMLGVVTEDDDGNASSSPPENPAPPQRDVDKPAGKAPSKSEFAKKVESWFGYPPEETKMIAAAWRDLQERAGCTEIDDKDTKGTKVKSFCEKAWSSSKSFEQAMKGDTK